MEIGSCKGGGTELSTRFGLQGKHRIHQGRKRLYGNVFQFYHGWKNTVLQQQKEICGTKAMIFNLFAFHSILGFELCRFCDFYYYFMQRTLNPEQQNSLHRSIHVTLPHISVLISSANQTLYHTSCQNKVVNNSRFFEKTTAK